MCSNIDKQSFKRQPFNQKLRELSEWIKLLEQVRK
jgi:hypothetical protein